MNTWIKVAAVAVAQLALVGVGVAPQLSARATGEEYLLRVQPYDPVDPFRGAYADLQYPDLGGSDVEQATEGWDTVYLPLRKDGDVWVADEPSAQRPDQTPYLTCDGRDWRLRCGIESLFLPQDEAAAVEDLMRAGDAVAVVRIDSRGHAAVVDVRRR